MQSFYSSNLSLGHAYIKVNIKEDQFVEEACEYFNKKLSELLSAHQGKVMHTKSYQTTSKGSKSQQIRSYFAYGDPPFANKEQWLNFVQQTMAAYMEGMPTFVEMLPASRLRE